MNYRSIFTLRTNKMKPQSTSLNILYIVNTKTYQFVAEQIYINIPTYIITYINHKFIKRLIKPSIEVSHK